MAYGFFMAGISMKEVKLINLICGHSVPKKKANKGTSGVWWCKYCKKYVEEKELGGKDDIKQEKY